MVEEEAGGGAGDGALGLLRHSVVVSWSSWESLECVLERFLVSVEQVKSSHAIAELWHNLIKVL